MSDEELVRRLRNAERHAKKDSLLELLFVDAADYIEHCHASHDAMTKEIEWLKRERDEAREQLRLANIDCFNTEARAECVEAELAAEREKAFTAMRVFERYRELEAQIAATTTRADAAERKVEKLREALNEIMPRYCELFEHAGLGDGNESVAVEIARAALAETETEGGE